MDVDPSGNTKLQIFDDCAGIEEMCLMFSLGIFWMRVYYVMVSNLNELCISELLLNFEI